MIIDIEVERNKERNESSNKIINLYVSDAIWRIVVWNIFWYSQRWIEQPFAAKGKERRKKRGKEGLKMN